jgi:hypothetical protein
MNEIDHYIGIIMAEGCGEEELIGLVKLLRAQTDVVYGVAMANWPEVEAPKPEPTRAYWENMVSRYAGSMSDVDWREMEESNRWEGFSDEELRALRAGQAELQEVGSMSIETRNLARELIAEMIEEFNRREAEHLTTAQVERAAQEMVRIGREMTMEQKVFAFDMGDREVARAILNAAAQEKR